ncbi:MAG: hypothetical protein IT532_04375 [Burkholderiales bacterium]|nr:hypothetical protein [Burkholderiales bacterium]
MLRPLIWVIGLFALAVALTVAARYSTGFVLVVLPTHRIELSITLAVLLLLLAFLALYVLASALLIALGMPGRARAYRATQERARARRVLENGLRAFLEGRYGRAQRAVSEAAQAGEWPGPSLALAARSAHELRDYAARDAYLEQMETRVPDEVYLREITRAELLLGERRHHDALLALGRLPEPHTGALALELKAQQLAGNWDRVLALIPQLEKRKALDAVVIRQLRRHAITENIRRRALDLGSLREYLEGLGADQRRDGRVAAAAAERLIDLGDAAEAHRLVEDSLEHSWDPGLLRWYVASLPKDARRHLERAEEWLGRHPDDAQLLHALGELCMHQELWGKARSYLEASLAVEPSHSACIRLGQLLEHTGRHEEANDVYRRGLDLALARLNDATGGRRRQAW